MKRKLILFVFLLIGGNTLLFSQNVAINGTGAVANTSAMLDVSATNKGILVPNVALTATNLAGPIAGPAISLLVYNTATASIGATAVAPGYYYWDGAQWVRLFNTGNDWQTTGNYGTNAATNYLGTNDNTDFVTRTNGIERMRVTSAGNVGIGINAPIYPLYVNGLAGITILGTNTNANNDGVWGYNLAAAGVGGGAGVVGISSQAGAGSGGTWGENANASGTGAVGTGNGQGGSTLIAGSGGAFTGFATAIYGRTNTVGASQVLYSDNFGAIVRVNYYNGTQYKVNGAGTVACVVPDLNNNLVTMHCAETPEFYYSDYGQGQLVNGFIHIELDPIMAKNVAINEKHPLRVFIQLEDNEFCKGVVVKNKTVTGFDVVELNGGTSNTPFQWNIVCNAADMTMPNGRTSKFADLRFERAEDPIITNEPTKKITLIDK